MQFDKFGTSVDISADGSVIIVGAEFGKAKYGSATVFEYKSGSIRLWD